MSNDYSGYPLIAILTPFVLAFIIGLFKEKYIKIKKAIVVLGCIASFIITVLLIKPVFLDGKIITYWLGNWKPVDNIAIGIGIIIRQSDALFIVGVFWGLEGLNKATNYLNEGLYYFTRKEKFIFPMSKAIIEFV